MNNKKFAVTGIGNAIVDVLIYATDDFLVRNSIKKGVMQLIDLRRSEFLYKDFGSEKEVSGGSGANTIVGLASLGLKTCYIGKVSNDVLGNKFRHDLRKMKIAYETSFSESSKSDGTGRCIIFVTPDGERSMNTYLGVTEFLNHSDIDISTIGDSEWIYLEGYRLDGQESEKAFTKAIEIAKKNNSKIALSLSDPFCVERNFTLFKKLISNGIDLLVCNEFELKLLSRTNTTEDAMRIASRAVPLLACTVGENGVLLSEKGHLSKVNTEKVKPVDTTGAGDLFAAGFLFGLVKRKQVRECGKMGNLAASAIIGHLGPRPEVSLKKLFRSRGLLN